MLLLSLLLNALLLLQRTEAGDPVEAGLGLGGDPAGDMKAEAVTAMVQEQTEPTSQDYLYFFEIKDTAGQTVARLNLTQGPFYAELVKTTKNEAGMIVYVMDGSRELKYGRYNFTGKPASVSATKSETITEHGNSTKLEITFSYKESGSNNTLFDVQTAELKMRVEWGVPARLDYWNITSINLTLKANVNSTSKSLEVDLTPRFSYNTPTEYSISPACTTGYGICAPLGLCWSCTDQVLRAKNLTVVKENQLSVLWHLPGMVLEPEWGNTANLTGAQFRFSANWDCDPLIPLSVWVGLLVTLLLVSILAWGLQMLADLQTPNKWDDPKKPGIHVPQAE